MFVRLNLTSLVLLIIVKKSFPGSSWNQTHLLVLYSTNQISPKFFQKVISDAVSSDFGSYTLDNFTSRRVIGTEYISIISVKAKSVLVEFYDLGASCNNETVAALSILTDKEFFKQNEYEVNLVGPSCSDSAYAVAQLIKRSGVSVRHFHTSPLPAPLAAEVSNTSVGLLPPIDLLAEASVALIKHANWSQVLALYQDDDTDLSHVFMQFQSLLQVINTRKINTSTTKKEVCKTVTNATLASSTIVNNGHVHLKGILEKYKVRIIFLFLEPKQTKIVLCQWKNYSYPEYQWVILKTSFEEILSIGVNITICSRPELKRVLQNAIAVGYNSTRGYTDYIYHHGIQMALKQQKNDLNAFPILVNQFQNLTKTIASYSLLNNSLVFNEHSISNFIPSEFKKISKFVDTSLFIFTLVIILVLTLSTMVVQILIISYRKSKSIRATGPKVQQLAFIGIYMLITALIIYTLIKSVDLGNAHIHFCIMYNVIASSAISLLLSALTMHYWRLYRIFHHFMNPGEMLSNKSLIVTSTILASFPVVLCASWLIIERPVRQEASCISFENRVRIVTFECGYKYFYEFFMLSIIYDIVLIIAMIILFVLAKCKIPKRQIHFRQNNVLWLIYCSTYTFVVGYSIISISYYVHDLKLEFFTAITTHVSLIIVFLMFLFVYPLIYACKVKKNQT